MSKLIKHYLVLLFFLPGYLFSQNTAIGFQVKPGISIMIMTVLPSDCPQMYQDPTCISFEKNTFNHIKTVNFTTSFSYTITNYFNIETGISFFNRGARYSGALPMTRSLYSKQNFYYLDIPLVLNFHYKNFYIGAGASLNFFIIQKYKHFSSNDIEWERVPNHNLSKISFSFIAQTGYIHEINDKLSLRGGLYFNYLYSNTEFKNYGVDLGVLFQLDNKSSR